MILTKHRRLDDEGWRGTVSSAMGGIDGWEATLFWWSYLDFHTSNSYAIFVIILWLLSSVTMPVSLCWPFQAYPGLLALHNWQNWLFIVFSMPPVAEQVGPSKHFHRMPTLG